MRPVRVFAPSDTKSERHVSFIEQASEGVGIAHAPAGVGLLGLPSSCGVDAPASRFSLSRESSTNRGILVCQAVCAALLS